MPFLLKNKPVTLEERLNGVAATKSAALSVFHAAAKDLQTAVEEAEQVHADAEAEIGRLVQLRGDAAVASAEATAKARLIREHFLGE